LIEKFEAFYCVYIVRPYERAVHIRGGRLLKVSPPGWYFKRPFEYDEIHKLNVVYDTINLNTQVVTDNKKQSYVISSVIGWQIREEACAKLIIELEDYEDVLANTVYGELARVAREYDFDNVSQIEEKAATAIRRKLGRYGVDLKDLWITDLAKARTYRLVTGND